jgi:hypothetical protein
MQLSRITLSPIWFERTAIEALLDEHQVGRHDHGKKLWALFILFAVAGRRDASVGVVAQSAAAAGH